MKQQTRVLNYWSLVFGAFGIILIAMQRGLSIASAHAFLGMVLIRQISIVFDKEMQRLKIESLEERLNAFDPYAPEIEPE